MKSRRTARADARSKSDRTEGRSALRTAALVAAAFSLAASIAFGPALHAPFDFDDYPAIVRNSTIRTFDPPWAPLHTPPLGTPASGRPAANVSFALSYALNDAFGVDQTIGVDPASTADTSAAAFGFRLANIALHVLTALLIFATIRLTIRFGRVADELRGRAAPIAFAISGLWLIHPLQTEAVDYVSQRTEILVSLWFVATLYAAIRHWSAVNTDRAGRGSPSRWLALALVSSAIGMATKEVMISLPLVVALHDRAFLSDSWRELWSIRSRRVLYFALLASTSISIALILGGGRAATVGFDVGITPLQYLVSQGWAIPHYLRLALWPNALSYDYGQTPILGATSVAGLCALGALGLAVIWGWTKPRWHWLAFLGAVFFLLLAPSSSIVPIRTEIAAERRVYLALACVIAALVIGAISLTKRLSMRASSRRIAQMATAGVIAIALIVTSAKRSAAYQSPAALWLDALAKLPSNGRAYDNVGAIMLRANPPRYASADSMFALAIAHDSSLIEPWLRRGAVAAKLGRFDDAERYLSHVLQVAPEDSDATSKLGKVLLAAGQPQRAIPFLRKMAERSNDPTAFTDLGNAYLLSDRPDSAIAPLQQAIVRHPRDAAAYTWLGAALVELKRGREAVAPLERAASLDPRSGFALGLLSVAYGEAGQGEDAVRAAAAAVDRANGDAGVFVFAGRGLEAAHRVDLAIRCYREAVKFEPRNPDALTRLGIAEASIGDKPAAVQLLKRALALTPNYPPAAEALGLLGGVK